MDLDQTPAPGRRPPRAREGPRQATRKARVEGRPHSLFSGAVWGWFLIRQASSARPGNGSAGTHVATSGRLHHGRGRPAFFIPPTIHEEYESTRRNKTHKMK